MNMVWADDNKHGVRTLQWTWCEEDMTMNMVWGEHDGEHGVRTTWRWTWCEEDMTLNVVWGGNDNEHCVRRWQWTRCEEDTTMNMVWGHESERGVRRTWQWAWCEDMTMNMVWGNDNEHGVRRRWQWALYKEEILLNFSTVFCFPSRNSKADNANVHCVFHGHCYLVMTPCSLCVTTNAAVGIMRVRCVNAICCRLVHTVLVQQVCNAHKFFLSDPNMIRRFLSEFRYSGFDTYYFAKSQKLCVFWCTSTSLQCVVTPKTALWTRPRPSWRVTCV